MKPIDKLKQMIAEMCDQACSLEDLCGELDLNYNTLRKEFRREAGMCLCEFLQRCRLEKAKLLLSDPDKPVFEVAYDMNFRHEANFTRWFTRRMGYSPSAFRERVLRENLVKNDNQK